MNKKEFIKKLKTKLNINEKTAIIIASTLENNFLIDKNNKTKTINNLQNNLKIDETKAKNIYNESTQIIKQEIKNKLKHPFKDID